ncbi:Na(+)/H(+) antiporter subunit E [Corynebacterium kutscheri]|uniref:Na+/H+ ion antiporter subunit n=1 Tax=Corynebacterium kutscheri TaxID=35755 RepID=A0A0F6QYY4_9CORY|nr:monovalent cation/H+ antiporter subunit E [Corynebacterium kutscheri]AKE40400.1 Na+/H+ ion antiporter subunit [Corynebacterium kutscheri]VEH10795.1 Na(+)/H(+) antiporter subunit E [Corynebacterium kutscheri]VEH80726.1 Na(+)/H(+) antiporter subunit E [Corynebacterium kutscheri]
MHALIYIVWLIGQVIMAAWTLFKDTVTGSKNIDPCVVHYPLRIHSDFLITAFAASITATPGTLSLTLHSHNEQRFLYVHAVAGADPQAVVKDLAHMEEMLSPRVKDIPLDWSAVSVEKPAPAPKWEDN